VKSKGQFPLSFFLQNISSLNLYSGTFGIAPKEAKRSRLTSRRTINFSELYAT